MTAATNEVYERFLTPDALRFLKALNQKFNSRRLRLLAQRKVVQKALDEGADFPDFLESTKHIRDDLSWSGAKIPDDMLVGSFYHLLLFYF